MIRWITKSLGTAAAASREINAEMAILDVTDLVDKFGNSPSTVLAKIEHGVALLKQGRNVVICCDYGISRSNAVAAGVLARASGTSINEAIKQVLLASGENDIKLEPLNAVRLALEGTPQKVIRRSNARILLTGGSGFIGQYLQKALAINHYVFAPSRKEIDLLNGALHLDLVAKEHGVDCIIHLANPRVYTSNRAIGETLTALKNVLDVCNENRLSLVYLSGWEVYSGYKAQEILADENLPLLPKGPYGEAKFLAETLIEHHRKAHRLKCALLRSSPVYGETSDRPKFIHNFIRKALQNVAIKTHRYLNGPPHLDLLHIDDLVSAIIAVINAQCWETLNLGSGNCVSTHEVGRRIIRKLGSTSTIEFQEINDYASNIRMDSSTATALLGWKPKVDLELGLDQLIAVSKNT